MEGIQTWWEGIQQQFYMNFIEDDRWKYLWNGLGVTLQLTFCAVLIGSGCHSGNDPFYI